MTAPPPLAQPLVLRAAWRRVAARGSRFAGADGVTPQAFAADLEGELGRLAEALGRGAYRPRPFRRVVASGGRVLDVPAVRDRVVEAAVLGWLRPRLEPRLSDAAYGYRPGRSVAGAQARLLDFARAGRPVAARADVRRFFPSVSHARVLAELERAGVDGALVALVHALLAAPSEGGSGPPGLGLPVGSALSPLLSNVALLPFDRALEAAGHRHVRYGDDVAAACPTGGEARAALAVAAGALRDLGLALHPGKSRVVPFARGVPFLGETLTLPDAPSPPPPPPPSAMPAAPPPTPPALPAPSTAVPAAAPRVLVVHTQGATVRARGEALEVVGPSGGGVRARVGVPKLGRLVLVGTVLVTPAALRRCARAGVGVVWLTRRGALAARVVGAAEQPAATVRGQCAVADDPAARLAVARTLVAAKVAGQRAVLLRRARRAASAEGAEAVGRAARRLRHALRAVEGAGDLAALRGVEGAASATYFEAWPALLEGAPLSFGGRSRRPPRDGVNAVLSFAYTLAHGQVRGLAEAHGLHPQVGFLHEDRAGHAALASDLVEPVRPALDHALLAALRRGVFTPDDFDTSARGGVYLSAEARPRFLRVVDRAVRRPRPGGSLWSRMAAEAASLARSVRGGGPYACAPFVGRPVR